MADISHVFGQDIDTGPTGDLGVVTGTVQGQQRVLRRLLTAVASYIWPAAPYGGGLASYIGTATPPNQIAGVIRAQLALESAVAQSPEPVINATPFPGGISVDVAYVDADTGQQVSLSFDVNE
jgi:hypothetical protein